jgi:hypothetical protein
MNLSKVITKTGLSNTEVANHLFPSNRHPYHALNRVINGISKLDVDQAKILAELANISINELYSGVWKHETVENVHIFKRDNFEARLNTRTWVTTVRKSNSLIHDAILHGGSITLSEYIASIEKIIEKCK